MRICFPISKNAGLESMVFRDFGSAPRFLVFDTEARAIIDMPNNNRRYLQGACRPLKALGNTHVDTIVVSGIGNGALLGLSRAGFRIYQAKSRTVADNVAAMENGELEEIHHGTCGDNEHGHECGYQVF
jgi:predicted Fe-Mo cluster-binding NifX family protein